MDRVFCFDDPLLIEDVSIECQFFYLVLNGVPEFDFGDLFGHEIHRQVMDARACYDRELIGTQQRTFETVFHHGPADG